jgi:ribA/ribD-fused uncharacterized protein
MEPIFFYRTGETYGCFSNFSAHPVTLKGKRYPTSEHYFQAMKFEGTEHEEAIRKAAGPGAAAKMGRDRSRPLRKDWEAVKESVMAEVLYAKFTQHTDIKKILLGTGDAPLVEHTTNDSYWADGGDGSGKNRLGVLLMKVREQLRAEATNAS